MNFSKGLLALAAFSSALAFTACSDESPWSGSDSEGGISLNFSTDSRVMRQTRADDSLSPVVPASELFAVNLVKSDGSMSKSWESLESFHRETSFPIGDYSLTASFGDLNQEGFETPHYKGSANVHVSPGVDNPVSIVATLANSMVSVRYTDDFKANFPRYSAAVQTEGHDWVVFAQSETRPAYVAPSHVKLNLTLTNAAGEQVTLQPAEFDANARHHYVITVGVSGNVTTGDLLLDVQFDEDVVAETVDVSLGDELFSAPAPSVKAVGFNPDGKIDTFEGAVLTDRPEFHVFSFAGLKSAQLTVVAPGGYTPPFGSSVELVNADAATQQALISAGVDAAGFFRNPDKMGVVNVASFLSKLPAGSYTVELQVVDAMTRTSEPLKLHADVWNVEMTLTAVGNVDFMGDEVTLDILTNCPAIKDNITFQAPDASNRMVDAPVKSVTQLPDTRTSGVVLRYVVGIEPQVRTSLDIRASLGDKVRDVNVPMTAPEYTILADAFSRKVVLKVEADNDDVARKIFDLLRFTIGATEIPTANVSHEPSSKFVTISGLTPSTSYALKAHCGDFVKELPEFVTETETPVANGNFNASTKTIDINPIAVGGQYTGTAFSNPKYTIKSSIERMTPDGWANLNPITCWTGASNLNTWFVVPSTWTEEGRTVIRTVGYSHNGTTPDLTKKTAVYYCQNAPSASDLTVSSGELFLGSYSFNGTSSRTDGILWASRPSSLSFDYSYVPYNNEQGEAYVQILDAEGKVLASQDITLAASSSMTTKSVALSGYPFGVKAASLRIGFRSTKQGLAPTVSIPSGTALNEGVNAGNFTSPPQLAANSYHAVATGSVLTIDNVTLGYGADATRGAKSIRKR